MLEISHEKPHCLARSHSRRQCACRFAVVSMLIFSQLQQQQQQGQQPGQQQALGLQPVQPQQPLVSRGDCQIFWGGVRVVTERVLCLTQTGSVAAWGEGLCKLSCITACLLVLPPRCLRCGTSTALSALWVCARCQWRRARFACVLSWPQAVAVVAAY